MKKEKKEKNNYNKIAFTIFGVAAIAFMVFFIEGFDVNDGSQCPPNELVITNSDGKWVCSGDYLLEDDLRFPVTSTRLAGSAQDATFETFIDNTIALGFSPTIINEGYLSAQLPHSRKDNTTLEFHFHWSPTTTNTGSVRWCIDITCANIGGTFTTPTTECVTDAADGIVNKHQMTSYISINNSLTYSAQCQMRLFRNATDSLDDYTGTALLHEFDMHYKVFSLGQGH